MRRREAQEVNPINAACFENGFSRLTAFDIIVYFEPFVEKKTENNGNDKLWTQ